jgi:two-component system chemotaxis sensor kinase CheA
MNYEQLTAMLNDPEMKEIVDSFIIETKEIIDSLDIDLIELERNPGNEDLINKVFRSFHTIKGTSSFLNLNKLTTITHRCEDILNKIRKKETKLNHKIMDLLLQGFDKIKELVNKIENDKNEDVETELMVDKLTQLYTSLGWQRLKRKRVLLSLNLIKRKMLRMIHLILLTKKKYPKQKLNH